MATLNSNPYPSALKPLSCSSRRYQLKLSSNLNLFRLDKRFCDVDLAAGGATYSAHRVVLSAASEYFEVMFRPELGLNEAYKKTVVLHTIDGDILSILLDFVYTGRCEITQSNVQDLLAAAHMLQLHEIVDGCCEFLCRELHASNALGILRFAEAYNCEALTKNALEFVHGNFLAISLEDEFLEIPQKLLVQVLTSWKPRLVCMGQVFQAVLRWIKHDVSQRRCFVFDIMSWLPTNDQVPVKILEKEFHKCQDMSLKISLRSICRNIASKQYQLSKGKKTSHIWHLTNLAADTLSKYDTRSKPLPTWSKTAPMKTARILPKLTALNGKIYVVGGERKNDEEILASGEVYDPHNDCWSPMAPMNVPRCAFGLCSMDNSLVAVGGWTCDGISDSIERYDPDNDSWEIIGNLPEPRFNMGVISFQGLIYIVGGSTISTQQLPDLMSFNPVTNEWKSLAMMNIARSHMYVREIEGKLAVIGGYFCSVAFTKCVETYSFEGNVWTSSVSCSLPLALPSVAVADGVYYMSVESEDVKEKIGFYFRILVFNYTGIPCCFVYSF